MRYLLSNSEARLLSALDDEAEATVPDLSASSGLVPSGVQSAVSRLTHRGFVTDSGRFIRLTPSGVDARRMLTGRSVLVIPDEVAAPSADSH